VDRRAIITVAAAALLVASLPVTWGIADVRQSQAVEEKTADVRKVVDQRHAPSDYDGDGINDSSDNCPRRPETENGFQDDDGCPDVVATTGAS
jgi:hypothetical protein